MERKRLGLQNHHAELKGQVITTCGHIKEEGEYAPSVIAGPQDPPWGIERQRQHATGQFTRATFDFLSRGDVHHLQQVLTVSDLDRKPEWSVNHLHMVM